MEMVIGGVKVIVDSGFVLCYGTVAIVSGYLVGMCIYWYWLNVTKKGRWI